MLREWKRGMAKQPSGPQKLQCWSTESLTWHYNLPQGHSLALGPCPEPDPANTSLASLRPFPVDHCSMRWSSGDVRVGTWESFPLWQLSACMLWVGGHPPKPALEHQPCSRSWHMDHAAAAAVSYPSHRYLLMWLWIVTTAFWLVLSPPQICF